MLKMNLKGFFIGPSLALSSVLLKENYDYSKFYYDLRVSYSTHRGLTDTSVHSSVHFDDSNYLLIIIIIV